MSSRWPANNGWSGWNRTKTPRPGSARRTAHRVQVTDSEREAYEKAIRDNQRRHEYQTNLDNEAKKGRD